MHTLDILAARRLALARAGLLSRRWSDLPRRAAGDGQRARKAAYEIIRRFGYLQLDSVSVAGARSHTLVMLSRLEGFEPSLGEDLLRPSAPLFEYWGHEASWLPMELYPVMGFRRQEFRVHPWWGDLLGKHPDLADGLLRRMADEGPLRSVDLEQRSSSGWWNIGLTKKVMSALWSRGDVVVRQRSGFQRIFDLSERIIDASWRGRDLPRQEALQQLLLKALDGHGWATQGTLASTWRLRNCRDELKACLESLHEQGKIQPCRLLKNGSGKGGPRNNGSQDGWIRTEHLELAASLRRARPGGDQGVLLSPFDPVLWDRRRVAQLFGFEQLLEIFKPAAQRRYGYYCLPVLAGEWLVGRVDLKAQRKEGNLRVLARHRETMPSQAKERAAEQAIDQALQRYADALGLQLTQG